MTGLILLAAADSTLGTVVLVAGLVVLVLGIYFIYQGTQASKTYNEALSQLDAERAEFERSKKSSGSSAKPKKTKKAEPKKAPKKAEPKKKDAGPSKQETELRARLEDARTSLDELKQKTREQTQELKELRARDKAARDAKPQTASSDVLFDLRQELGEAKAEVETLKTKLADSKRSGGKKAPAEPAPEPKKVEKPKKAESSDDSDAAASVDVDSIHDEYRGKLSTLSREKDSLERDLRGKLNRSSRDIDRQRRRADNNDKAYKITQRELDAARERISLLEVELGRIAFAAKAEQGDDTPAEITDAVTEANTEVVDEAPAAAVEVPAEETPAAEAVEAAPVEEAPSEETPAEEPVEEAKAEETPSEPAQEAVEAAPVTEDAPAEEPAAAAAEEEAPATEAAPAESETSIDEEIRRKIEEGTSSLGAEVSSVDEAWADIDLDDDEL